jgi:hypothetical protein
VHLVPSHAAPVRDVVVLPGCAVSVKVLPLSGPVYVNVTGCPEVTEPLFADKSTGTIVTVALEVAGGLTGPVAEAAYVAVAAGAVTEYVVAFRGREDRLPRMLGVTVNAVAFVVVQEKLTVCPGAATFGVTEKANVGAVWLVPLFPELLPPPPHAGQSNNKTTENIRDEALRS